LLQRLVLGALKPPLRGVWLRASPWRRPRIRRP
jgi:hypothetical protein